ncbi:MAG: hypothetical protein K1Y36_22160 [Blastocatellia bacterium]|nr:hypothetical protein [Blastocatellia bacterium]
MPEHDDEPKYNRIIRLRGSETFEPATKAFLGYELDPNYNLGVTLTIRGYLVAEDYSLDEFAALVQSEDAKKAETERFRSVFLIDSRTLPETPAEPEDEN